MQSKIISGLLIMLVTMSLHAVSVSDKPFLQGGGAQTNIMFIMDDSGSMDWDYLPDNISCSNVDYDSYWGGASSSNPELTISVKDASQTCNTTQAAELYVKATDISDGDVKLYFSYSGDSSSDEIDRIYIDMNNDGEWRSDFEVLATTGIYSSRISGNRDNSDERLRIYIDNNDFNAGDDFALRTDFKSDEDIQKAKDLGKENIKVWVEADGEWYNAEFSDSGSISEATVVIDDSGSQNNCAEKLIFDFKYTGQNYDKEIDRIKIDLRSGDWITNQFSVSSVSGVNANNIDRYYNDNDENIYIRIDNNDFKVGDSFSLEMAVEKLGDNLAKDFAAENVSVSVELDDDWLNDSKNFQANGSESFVNFTFGESSSSNEKYKCKANYYNKIYYDPDTIYLPPLESDGERKNNAVITNAMRDGFDVSSNKKDVSGWEYYVYDEQCGDIDALDCFDHYAVSDLSAEGKTNFANWYSFYRTRMLTAKSGAANAFSKLDGKYRLGYGNINRQDSDRSPGIEKTIESYVSPFTGDNKDNFYKWLFALDTSGRTPLRRGLDSAGRYFETNHPYREDTEDNNSALLSCTQNYTILMTDGYRNGKQDFDYIGNADKNGSSVDDVLVLDKAPFSDNDSETLGDIAMYYWKRDLNTSLENNVPVNDRDPAYWQHMVSIGIGLGVVGNIDPEIAFESIATESTINWDVSNDAGLIDDLLHAAVNSRGAFFSADDPVSFVNALDAAISDVQTRTASGTSVSLGGELLIENDQGQETIGQYVYKSTYSSADWSGIIKAYEFDSTNGVLNTEVDGWSVNFPSERNIYTLKRKNGLLEGAVFENKANNLDTDLTSRLSAQASLLGNQDLDSIIDYFKGDQSLEIPNGPYRKRKTLLGDIVNSTPVYIDSPNKDVYRYAGWDELDSYDTFVANNISRTKVLYVASNDGMLHALNAETGDELFAYMPREILTRSDDNIAELADPNYQHRYFVDGPIVVADVFINKAWKTVLIGSLGRGGKSVYALDISDPDNFSEKNVLWEISGNEIGNVINEPVINRLDNGKWVVVFGNGYNSSSDEAALIAVDIETGVYGSIPVLDENDQTISANGLSGVLLWDSSSPSDYNVDKAYAGDLKGYLFEFDLSNLNFEELSTFSADKSRLLFKSTDQSDVSQTITSSITGREDDYGQLWLYFGTGQMLAEEDLLVNTPTNSWYGIKVFPESSTFVDANDDEQTYINRSMLSARHVVDTVEGAIVEIGNYTSRLIDENDNALDIAETEGWVIDLADKEKILDSSQLRGDVLIVNTFIPVVSTGCSSDYSGYIMAIDPFTGLELSSSFFDFNDDSLLDVTDLFSYEVNGKTIKRIGSGISFRDAPNRPVFSNDKMLTQLIDGTIEMTTVAPITGVTTQIERLFWREVR